ncbi:unnamed protein product [marine sediment metagenome]|uniref:Uncharacterized protein n=1 Tax=marine sediment metagenome TaxID=412755 RepID=X1EZQ6_9ZZZZ
MKQVSKIKFEMRRVDKKREKKYLKGSIYDPMIDQFLESGHNLVQITVERKKASYVVTQLNKRIEKRGLDIVASWADDIVYLEKKS